MKWNEETVRYLREFLGVRYLYGGNNPSVGIDCSGLVCEGLRFSGLIKFHEDLSAQGLFAKFATSSFMCVPPFRPGTLLFFGKPGKIEHVGMASTGWHMIEAAGGNPATTTPEAAAKQNAFVKERPYWYRSDFVTALFPPYPYASGNGVARPDRAEEINYPF